MKRILCFLLYCCLCCSTAYADRMCLPTTSASFTSSVEVVAKSDKDLSNVVLKFCDGTTQKFDGLSGYCQSFSGTGDNEGKKIVGVFIKSGCNGDNSQGPGFGDFHANPDEDVCEPTQCEPDEYYDEETETCKPVCEAGYDECGVCGGTGAGECGCNLEIEKDECGVCGGDNSTCVDCAGVPNGTSVVDECGVCGGSGKDECGNCPDSQNPIVKDQCGVCGGDGTSCQLEVCQVLDGNYDNAKVVTILESEFDETKHFDKAQCEPTTICIKHLEGPTKVVPFIAFYNVYRQQGALLGECQLSACVKDETGRYASIKFVLESELEALIEAGRATRDLTQCDTVRICINPGANPPTSKLIPKFVADWYFERGYKEGHCPIKVCRPGIESEADATVIEIDPSERLETDRPVSDCEPYTICLDGQTLTLPKFVAIPLIVNDGATQGECSNECEYTEERCHQECVESYDPAWVPKCTMYCVENCGIYCEGDKDCIFEGLEPRACANANGYLGQVNIATVTNTTGEPLKAKVTYRDLHGQLKGEVEANVVTKSDFIINDLGLEPDTYGTVCVETDATEPGKWSGGVTLYKGIDGNAWGGPYEFALYYPFENAKTGFQAVALNSFNLGGSATANWIRLTDTEVDGHPLTGKLFIYRGDGVLGELIDVAIPDGGRFDFSGHDALGFNQVGTAILALDAINGKSPKVLFSSARYGYNCAPELHSPFACNDFLTGFVTPNRTPIKGTLYNQVSSVDELTYLEIHNPLEKPISVTVDLFAEDGTFVGNQVVNLPIYGVVHLPMHTPLGHGIGSVKTNSADYYIASASHYTLEGAAIGYGYSVPFTKLTPNKNQMTEFNSFLNQDNLTELTNTLHVNANGTLTALDYQGNVVFQAMFSLSPNSTTRYKLDVPADTYGIVLVDIPGVLVRNHVVNQGQYVLPFLGK